jgi:hypothetical protein
MNATTRNLTIAATLALALGASAPARAQAADPDGYGDGYQQGDFGRIRASENGASILRVDGQVDGDERAGVNAPIFPGDTVRTGGDQRVEIQLADGTIVRLDRGSELVFQSLPDPSSRFQDNSVLALNAGRMRIASEPRDKNEFRIDTPDASIYLNGSGEVRVETDGARGTRVESVRGVAEVVGNDSSVLVRGGERTIVIAGGVPDDPRAFTAYPSDGFDRWCASRHDAYRSYDRYAAEEDIDRGDVPDEVEPYYGELSASGTWGMDPTYGTVWYPGGMGVGWSPYTNGYWSYGPGGYFWVSYEPWGWAPYHYGNWQYIGSRGWGWVPGSVFAGAWVSWSWGSAYVGWAPLNYWGQPAYISGPSYYGYYDPGCWTFVGYGHLSSSNVRRYAVPAGQIGDDLRHATVVSRAPRVDPRRYSGPNNLRDRALRDIALDKPSHMRPIDRTATPTRSLSQMQSGRGPQIQRSAVDPRRFERPGNAMGRGNDRVRDQRRAVTPSSPYKGQPRRILDDPRATERRQAGPQRPQPRNDVRDLYQRMSRPRETREPDADRQGSPRIDRPQEQRQAQRPQPRVYDDPRRQPQRLQPRVYDDPRRQPQRSQPRVYDMPRQQRTEPRHDAPRQPQRSQPRAYDTPRQQRPEPRYDAPRQPQRSQPRAYDAPRPQPQRQAPPRMQQGPRPQPQRAQPRGESSRPQQQRSAPSQKHDGNGNGNNKHR